MKIGFGYDIHRVAEGGAMFLGGVEVFRGKRLEGHSDGDVLLHAVIDAVLGALSMDDIGVLFPDTDQSIKGISSMVMLEKAASIMRKEKYALGNLDCVVVAERPKISVFREQIKNSIASALFSEPDKVSVKGKTKEGISEVGKHLAVEAYASVALVRDM